MAHRLDNTQITDTMMHSFELLPNNMLRYQVHLIRLQETLPSDAIDLLFHLM